MRLTLLAFAIVIAAGCKPPPPQLVETAFKREIRLYFNNLNEEATARKERMREEQVLSERNPALPPPTGTIYNIYAWDDSGFIVENFRCLVCGTKMLLPFPAAEYLCKSCGHCPYRAHPSGANLQKTPCEICLEKKGNADVPRELVEAQNKQALKDKAPAAVVKDMYEVTKQDKERGLMQATVRYVKRVYVYDDRATVSLTQKAIDRAQSDPAFIPTGTTSEDGRNKYDAYTRSGFHRQDMVYVGEINFEYRNGGDLVVKSGPREEPVRMWSDLGRNKN